MATIATLPLEAPTAHKTIPSWPFLLYALTGFTGVLAEQGFEKYMSLLVGATAAASAVVIFAYFLGFALGSWAIGALIRRGQIWHPLRTYGIIELLAGVSCIAFSYLFHPITQVLAPWQGLYSSPVLKFAVRFVFGSILILPTAALMGASFPLIATVVDRGNAWRGQSWLRAYALNLTGAVVAGLVGAYAIMPVAGIRGAFWLCFAIGALVFAASMAVGRQGDAIERPDDGFRATSRAALDRDTRVLLVGAFASGFVFFALEVIWTHLIGTMIGCSVYAFSAMLTMVLVGLLIGAFRIDRTARKRSAIGYSRIFQLSGLHLVIQLRLWDWGQMAFVVELPAPLQNFYGVEAFKLLLAALLIVPSAAMLGSIYPCLLRSRILERPGYAYLVGYLNTWNSLGCIAGAILGIFFLIPVLGAEWSLRATVIGVLGVGLLFLWRENPSRKVMVRAVLGIALVLTYALLWRWDHRMISSGMNVYFGQPEAGTPSAAPGLKRDVEMIFFEEDVQGGMTSVLEMTDQKTRAKERVLLTNGKYEGSDDLYNQGRAQIGFAAIPSLYTQRLGRALLIGLGTGHSALALARLGYEQVDIAEFAPGIVAASRTQFAHLTEGVLNFPNVALHLEDGRNVLQTHPERKYDLITVEITSVWFAGATNVYSQEFYELAKKRIGPGGVLQQWLQLHHIASREVESMIATVRSVFPYVSFWYTGGQGMIVASSEPQASNPEREKLLTDRMGVLVKAAPSEQARIARDMFHSRIMSPALVDRMIRAAPPVVNTDHNRWLEYSTPRYNASSIDWVPRNLAFLRSFEQ